jgi:hypothetical protein
MRKPPLCAPAVKRSLSWDLCCLDQCTQRLNKVKDLCSLATPAHQGPNTPRCSGAPQQLLFCHGVEFFASIWHRIPEKFAKFCGPPTAPPKQGIRPRLFADVPLASLSL